MPFFDFSVDVGLPLCYNQAVKGVGFMIMLDKYDDKLYKLRSIGIHDSATGDEARFFRSKNYWALHYVDKGEGVLILRGAEYEVRSGMFFLTPPSEPINYYSRKEKSWHYYFISAYPDSMLDVIGPLGLNGGKFVVEAKHPVAVTRLFEEFFEKRDEHENLYFAALSVLNKILSLEYAPLQQKSVCDSRAELVENVDEIISFNYKDPEFSISDIAKMLHLHPSQLSRIYKAIKGESPVSHLADVRLCYAAAILESKNLSVAELCRKCGFGDERYFMRRFKRRFGKTVGEYKREITRKGTG